MRNYLIGVVFLIAISIIGQRAFTWSQAATTKSEITMFESLFSFLKTSQRQEAALRGIGFDDMDANDNGVQQLAAHIHQMSGDIHRIAEDIHRISTGRGASPAQGQVEHERSSDGKRAEKGSTASKSSIGSAPGPAPTPGPPRGTYYNESDWAKFLTWKKRTNFTGDRLPRVLIYTWATEETFTIFQNENYWKTCYAHLHGYDVVYSDKKNFTGVAVWHGDSGGDGRWYSEENMWAWWSDVQPYLFSGKYDYVFVTGSDTLIQGGWFEWPVWAYDRGHDMTIMDQDNFAYGGSYGLNQNNMLFRPTKEAKRFINEGFEYRRGFHLQSDNGPWMETILTTLSRWAVSEGKDPYNSTCYQYLAIPKPAGLSLREIWWGIKNDQYARCFFNELTRLAGPYGYRITKIIGFYPSFIGFSGAALLPDKFHGQTPWVPPGHPHYDLLPLGPWLNCWSSVRMFWLRPYANCFAYHWNGPKNAAQHSQISGGQCPDPSFDWSASPYNPANRGNQQGGMGQGR